MPIPASWSDRLMGLLRIVAGLCFLDHGAQKLLGFPPPSHAITLTPLITAAGALELIGGAMIVAGLFTRWTAFILSGEMAVAYFMFHAPQSFFPAQQRRRRGDPLLLRVPVLRLGRRRRVERGPRDAQGLTPPAGAAARRDHSAMSLVPQRRPLGDEAAHQRDAARIVDDLDLYAVRTQGNPRCRRN